MIDFMWFLLIPPCFQLFALVRDQKARHKELLSRLDRLEEQLGARQ